jgi:hypothetical protein
VRNDRRLCRTCVSYYLERYGHCVLIGKRVQGWLGGKPCWERRRGRFMRRKARKEPDIRADVGSPEQRDCKVGGSECH